MRNFMIFKSSILFITSLFSIGYASWNISNDFSIDALGKINAENIINKNVTSLKNINFDKDKPILVSDNGIEIDEELKNNITLSFTFELDNSTCEEASVIYECHLLCNNLNSSIEPYFQNIQFDNASIDGSYNYGFGPFANKKHEHIIRINVIKSNQENTLFSLHYNFNNFSEIMNNKEDININIKIFAI